MPGRCELEIGRGSGQMRTESGPEEDFVDHAEGAPGALESGVDKRQKRTDWSKRKLRRRLRRAEERWSSCIELQKNVPKLRGRDCQDEENRPHARLNRGCGASHPNRLAQLSQAIPTLWAPQSFTL